MFIVLEGCDATGKSTLAEEIAGLIEAQEGSCSSYHFGPPEVMPDEEYGFPLQWYDPTVGPSVVMDRFHWGDQVYGPLYREGDPLRLTEWLYWWLELAIQARGGITVYTTGSPQGILKRANALGEDYMRLTERDVHDILLAYSDLMHRPHTVTHALTHTIDSDALGTPVAPDRVVEVARARTQAALPAMQVTRHLIGDTAECHALLVGERPAKTEGKWSLPFRPAPNTSTEFLFHTLDALGLGNFVLTNAYESRPTLDGVRREQKDRPVDLGALWEALEKPNVVALGKVAHYQLEKAGVPHGRVVDPRWVLRMPAKKRQLYAPSIGLALLTGKDMGDIFDA